MEEMKNQDLTKFESPSDAIYTDKKFPNIIISDFKPGFKDVADVLSFQKEFLGRQLSDLQKEAYLATWGSVGGEWNIKYNQIALLVGMKGGKNFWMEGDIAYTAYFVSSLRNPHEYFSKITKRPIRYQSTCTFDIPIVTGVNETQTRFVTFYGIHRILKSTKDPKYPGDNWFERNVGLDLRDRFGDLTRNEIVFPEMVPNSGTGGLRIFGFGSNPASAEGLHILRYYADELSRADTKSSYSSAKSLLSLGVFNTMASFPNRVGKVILISYPNKTKYDITYEQYEKSKKSENIFGLKAATYEFNPCMNKDLLNEMEVDEEEFKLKYECIKPGK